MMDFSQWAGMTIAVLTILVTVLITWQIWQTIDTKRAIRDVFVMRTQFNDLRREIDTLHGMHEAFMLDIFGHDNRRKGQSCAAFDYFMRSAFIYLNDMKHYDNWFMSALSSMKTCFEDLYRPAMGPRDQEKSQFIQRKEEYISYLESLLRQVRGINRFSQQAEMEINFLIESLRKLKPRKDDFDED